ncbi:MAG: PIN domain-containing protein [Cyclobacteriaceae bacterium]
MKVLLDANVVVSVLNKEYPVFTYSSRLLSLSGQRGFHFFITPLSLSIAAYFSDKKSGSVIAKSKIRTLSDHLSIAIVDEQSLKQALNNKAVKDFEDGMQYYAALNEGCDCIVTENKSDFYFSEIEVVNCQEFLVSHARKLD